MGMAERIVPAGAQAPHMVPTVISDELAMYSPLQGEKIAVLPVALPSSSAAASAVAHRELVTTGGSSNSSFLLAFYPEAISHMPKPTPTPTPVVAAAIIPTPAPTAAPPPVPAAVYPAGSIQSIIIAAANRYHVSGAWMVKIATCESGLNPRAYNPSGPYDGLFQFLPSTFRANGGTDIWNPYQQANITADMLAHGQAYQWGCA